MSEAALQKKTADLLRRLGWLAWHTPNGEKRDKATAEKLKAMGVMPGVVDWLIAEPWEKDGQTGFMLAIELKWGKGKPTADQERFLSQVSKRGFLTAVCWTMDEFVATLRHIRPRNGRRIGGLNEQGCSSTGLG